MMRAVGTKNPYSALGVIQYEPILFHEFLERFMRMAHLHCKLWTITLLQQTEDFKTVHQQVKCIP